MCHPSYVLSYVTHISETSYILHHASYIIHPTSYIMHPTSYIIHPTSYSPTAYIIYHTLYIVHLLFLFLCHAFLIPVCIFLQNRYSFILYTSNHSCSQLLRMCSFAHTLSQRESPLRAACLPESYATRVRDSAWCSAGSTVRVLINPNFYPATRLSSINQFQSMGVPRFGLKSGLM